MVKNEVLIYIDGINYSAYLQFAPKLGDNFDASLDTAEVELKHLSKDVVETFKPMQRVELVLRTYDVDGGGEEIKNTREEETRYYLIENDSIEETPPNSGVYTHNITLTEPIKAFDGVVVDNITFTNVINKDYSTSGDSPYILVEDS